MGCGPSKSTVVVVDQEAKRDQTQCLREYLDKWDNEKSVARPVIREINTLSGLIVNLRIREDGVAKDKLCSEAIEGFKFTGLWIIRKDEFFSNSSTRMKGHDDAKEKLKPALNDLRVQIDDKGESLCWLGDEEIIDMVKHLPKHEEHLAKRRIEVAEKIANADSKREALMIAAGKVPGASTSAASVTRPVTPTLNGLGIG